MPGISETRTFDALLTTTLSQYRNKLVDNIFDVYPFLSWLNGKLGTAMRGESVKETKQGGESIVEQLLYEQNSTVDSYSNYGVLDTTPQEGMTIARYNWKQYSVSIAISGHERRTNRGEPQLISLLQGKMTQAEMSLRDRLSRDAFGDGTGNGGLNLTGLAALVSTSTTVGGIAPATHTWWQASVKSSAGSFATNGINEMRTRYNSLSFGNDRPDFIVTDQTVYESYDNALEDKQRIAFSGSLKVAGDAGFPLLAWMGTPVMFDRDCTSGTMYFLNSKYLKFCVLSGADFEPTPFMRPENQDATVAQILVEANLVTNNRRRLGKIEGFTA
jgi:hypothetical protein